MSVQPAGDPARFTCPICGSTKFEERTVLWEELATAWQLSPEEARLIDRQQGFCCGLCRSNLRSMTLASGLMTTFDGTGPFEDFCRFDERFRRKRILEINEAGSLTTWLRLAPQHRLVTYPEADMQQLGHSVDAWDLVVHSDSLEHVPDFKQALRECFRVLRPDGVLAFTVPLLAGRLTRAADALRPSYHGQPGVRPPDLQVHTEFGGDIWSAVMDCGFREVAFHALEHPASVAIVARKPRRGHLEFTGERLVPVIGVGRRIATEHLHRYALARELCRGCDVIDIASGEGYGSALLAQAARSVIGIDVDEKAVAHAAKAHGADNLQFRSGPCASIPAGDASVDVVVSFETLEHFAEHDEFCREIRRILRPGGLLILSTPDRAEYSERPSTANPHHVRELSRDEFETLLAGHFSNVNLFGQKYLIGSVISPEAPAAAPFTTALVDYNSASLQPGVVHPTYWLALCSDGPLPLLPAGVSSPPEETMRSWIEAIETLPSPQIAIEVARHGRILEPRPLLATRVLELEAAQAHQSQRIGRAKARQEKLEAKLAKREQELERLRDSWAWRAAKPIRWLEGLIIRFRKKRPAASG